MKWLLGVALVCSILGFFFWPRSSSAVTIAVASSPVSVWSWDRQDNTFTVVLFPSDVVAAARGYGSYSLEALWKLGFIDGKKGSVLAQSLEQAIAVRTPYFVGEKGDSLVPAADAVAYGKQLFSFSKLITNVPLPTFVSFSWALRGARLDAIQVIDVADKSVTVTEILPDNSKREVLDANSLDTALKDVFEDESIRSEEVTAAVYNTTDLPALGTQAARLLTNLGILVVTVGNAAPQLGTCTISGDRQALISKTAMAIKTLFSCTGVEDSSNEHADLVIRLGTNNAH